MIVFKDQLASLDITPALQQAADALGYPTYAVGGYVRDLFLGRKSKDIDFVCVGSGITLAKAIKKLLGKEADLAYFKNFGTAMIRYRGFEYEFVGARKESYDRHSRKPTVEEGSLQDDLDRRDFTINAMAISMNKTDFGTFVDPYHGIKDLEAKFVKTPLSPDKTFSDDPLRMMRAVRFAAQLNFDIDADTFEGIQAMEGRLDIISMERIIAELNKIILSPVPSYGFNLLFSGRLLHRFFPEMVDLHGVDKRDGKSHKDNFYHTLSVLDNVSKVSDDLWLRWAAILHDIAKPKTKRFHPKAGWTFHGHEDRGARMVPKIFKRLKLPLGDHMRYVQKLVQLHLRPIPLVKKEVTDSAIRRLLFDAGDDLEDLMLLCRADVTSKNEVRVKQYLKNFDIVEAKMREVEEKDQLRNFQPIITGALIMETFDLPPSRLVGDIKDGIREAILDGSIKNKKEEAIPYMYKIAEQHGLKKL